jgi:hypothetical protein
VALRDGISVRRVGAKKGNCIRKSLLSTLTRVVKWVLWVDGSSLRLGESLKEV